MRTPMYPRDLAGSFTLPPGTVGNITEMCGLDDFLEIYTPFETFKVQSPENIDPARTNPSAMWVLVRTHLVGSASQIVSRTLLMAAKCANLLQPMGGEKPLLVHMHGIKEILLQVQSAATALKEAITQQRDALIATDFRLLPNGRSLEYFPLVPDLNAKVLAFLNPSRRAITEICQIPNFFLKLTRQHSSLEHLLSKELKPIMSTSQMAYMQDFLPATKTLIELRNGLEHGVTTSRKLHIQNFSHTPNNQVRGPIWFLDGDEAQDIQLHAERVPEFLLCLAEAMFVACADATRREWPPLQLITVKTIDEQCPIRYQLVLDHSCLKFPDSQPSNP